VRHWARRYHGGRRRSRIKNGKNHAGGEGNQNSPIRLSGEGTGPLVRSRTLFRWACDPGQ